MKDEKSSIVERLKRDRKELLDLTARNRLLHTSFGRIRGNSIEVIEERSDPIFSLLVRDRAKLSFDPGEDSAESIATERAREDAYGDERSWGQPEAKHLDRQLQTRLADVDLQKRLLRMAADARLHEEERGVNVLYLAVGFLEWYDAPNSNKPHYAPLVLIPAQLTRASANSRFLLTATDDDLITNLTLQEKLRSEFGIRLPDLPEPEDLTPTAYFDQVRDSIQDENRWRVHDHHMQLGFYSFAKLLMYRDLDPANWPEERPLENHAALRQMFLGGFSSGLELSTDHQTMDLLLAPERMVHVLDADSSQTLAIEEARRGRSLIVQGPPGTGKSQTITNLIAALVKDGKTVLFVAEKMAALEVVYGRLEALDLGGMCLELHSHKANKRVFAQELARALESDRPRVRKKLERSISELRDARERLNRYYEILHEEIEDSGCTVYEVLGKMSRLRQQHVPPLGWKLPQASKWGTSERDRIAGMVEQLADCLERVGDPGRHPWRNVGEFTFLASDERELVHQLERVQEQFKRVWNAATVLCNALGVPRCQSLQDINRVAEAYAHATNTPPNCWECVTDPAWQTQFDQIAVLVAMGAELSERISGWRSWLRWFRPNCRRARRILDGTRGTQAELGKRAFSRLWDGAESDFAALQALIDWVAKAKEIGFPPWSPGLSRAPVPEEQAERSLEFVRSHLQPLTNELAGVMSRLKVDLPRRFGSDDLARVQARQVYQAVDQWRQQVNQLPHWQTLMRLRRQFDNLRLTDLRRQVERSRPVVEAARLQFEWSWAESLIRRATELYPDWQDQTAASQQTLIDRFQQCDRARIEFARQEVLLAHAERVRSADQSPGEMKTVRHEAKKKARHLPLRKLLSQAGQSIQRLKPVFLMSPISVAQFIEPGVLEFDVLVIDEASQVKPVDALGAFARANQWVIVGDEKQLPPTSFFDRSINDDEVADDEDEEDDSDSSKDVESILGLCASAGMPSLMLKWHYRSQHESLIAVSNQEFYDNQLYIVPSADFQSPELGVRFHHVAEGLYDSGKSRRNTPEARAVAKAVMIHARNSPRLSLGVGTFSVAQRDAILDELEDQRRRSPDTEPFFDADRPAPFFVKNLESLQGDERDVIFISVGYGRDRNGALRMNFGPVQTGGGERRLNVLISRAKQRCEVFSSITADDIDLTRARSRGAAVLKHYLAYAKDRTLPQGRPTERAFDSEFEEDVYDQLVQRGYRVETQVGVAGFFVDLAVLDPEQPGRYLLGVECDGARYHSSRSARDRDRLREELLVARGWKIHRIWSTDWFRDPTREMCRLVEVIEQVRPKRPRLAAAGDDETPAA